MYLVFCNWRFDCAKNTEVEAIESILDDGLDSMDYPFDLYVIVNSLDRNYFKIVIARSVLQPNLINELLIERDKLVDYGMYKVAQIKQRTDYREN